MKARTVRRVVAVVAALGCGAAAAADLDESFRRLDDAFGEGEAGVEQAMEESMEAVDSQWEALLQAEEARWEALRAEVEAKWGAWEAPPPGAWEDYSDDREVRSRVDFEQGRLVVEFLVPAAAPAVPASVPAAPPSPPVAAPAAPAPVVPPAPAAVPPDVRARVERQVEKLVSAPTAAGESPAAGQVVARDGSPVTAATAAGFAEREVLAAAVADPAPVRGRDGVERLRLRASVPLVQDHVQVRAARYRDLVVAEAARTGLAPQLVFAVMQTESFFNPLARAPSHKYGLMQLSPRYSALEALQTLEKRPQVPSPDYLYVPANNARLGSTYLNLLANRYFADVKDPADRELLVLAAYRWGAAPVRARVLEAGGGPVRQLLEERAPKDAWEFVTRVEGRKGLYDALAGPPAEGGR